MALLTLDFGNTAVKGGVFSVSGALLGATRVSYQEAATLASWVKQVSQKAISHCLYASVTPEATQVFLDTLTQTLRLSPTDFVAVVPGKTPLPISIHYPLDHIGVDRLVNACALTHWHPDRYRIIYDFGTATTIDVMGPKNIFYGGAITVGLQHFWQTLHHHTEQLPSSPLAPATTLLGQNTKECLQLGLAGGYTGLIQELDNRLTQWIAPQADSTHESPLKIATGGLAEAFVYISDGVLLQADTIMPNLTLTGLWKIAEQL